jgi:hypothetical protein
MHEQEKTDTAHQLANDYVLKTFVNVFVTGKAGTGKTTFLRAIRQNTVKNTVVAAPTGVAAINAGGMTLHSLFQLPLGPFVPTRQRVSANTTNLQTLFENLKLSKAKIELIRELELLIIDEVSMLRCDTLDCIDTILRTVRRQPDDAFGGVQVLFIGDLFQLPPVAKDEEWRLLNDFYDTPFFFSAQVMKDSHFVHIEFTHIYRQSEERFIRLLNKVRNNDMTEDDFHELNERYQPELLQDLDDFITLTTHNWKADKINQAQLAKLEGEPVVYHGVLEGEFNENALPTEMQLVLKTGAQIMFIKNDSTYEKRYYNGKLATVKRISDEEITVEFLEDGQEYILQKEIWENIRYAYNPASDKIEENKIGSFTQYPVRLAWAITIHKSQGLTFERAVIDAGQSFAAGQVYVALSRCRTLQGMFLMTRITQDAIRSDERIIDFTDNNLSDEVTLERDLPFHKIEFSKTQLVKAFDWSKLVDIMRDFAAFAEEKRVPDKELVIAQIQLLLQHTRELQETAAKFTVQLQDILQHIDRAAYQQLLQERTLKSIQYFGTQLTERILQPLDHLISALHHKKGVRGFLKKADEVAQAFLSKLQQTEKLKFGDTAFYNGTSFYNRATAEISAQLKQKPEKGASQRESLQLYKSGKDAAAIAAHRNMALSTIESHLAEFVGSGEINVLEFLTAKQLETIADVVHKTNSQQLSELKEHFGNTFSYGQLRMAVAHLSSLK